MSKYKFPAYHCSKMVFVHHINVNFVGLGLSVSITCICLFHLTKFVTFRGNNQLNMFSITITGLHFFRRKHSLATCLGEMVCKILAVFVNLYILRNYKRDSTDVCFSTSLVHHLQSHCRHLVMGIHVREVGQPKKKATVLHQTHNSVCSFLFPDG